jgi:hypothetical protein
MEDAILTAWLEGRPEVKLRTVEFGEEPGLWTRHAVRGTPSLLVEDGKTGRSVLLEGLAREDRLEAALREFRSAPVEAKSEKRGEKP